MKNSDIERIAQRIVNDLNSQEIFSDEYDITTAKQTIERVLESEFENEIEEDWDEEE